MVWAQLTDQYSCEDPKARSRFDFVDVRLTACNRWDRTKRICVRRNCVLARGGSPTNEHGLLRTGCVKRDSTRSDGGLDSSWNIPSAGDRSDAAAEALIPPPLNHLYWVL